jgi:hypothetical protein
VNIRILGAGFYGCHIALRLISEGHEVEVHDIADRVFAGASGNMPARLHLGFHYPRSKLTRTACQAHAREFEERYGFLTRGVFENVYAIAAYDSLLDFGTYTQILQSEVPFDTADPRRLDLCHAEGAVLTSERHVLLDAARDFFTSELGDRVHLNVVPGPADDPRWDMTIDCTFCALDNEDVDRYEACLTLLLEGPTDKAVTIMDGPFPSLYPWDEDQGLSSLTSARWTPMAKTCTWQDARAFIHSVHPYAVEAQGKAMIEQMASYYPRIRDEYRVAEYRLAIRAMPRSAAAARLVSILQVGERALRVRAGKLDAIFAAERRVMEMLNG